MAGEEGTCLERSFLDSKGASNFSGTPAVDNSVVLDEVSDYAEGVV